MFDFKENNLSSEEKKSAEKCIKAIPREQVDEWDSDDEMIHIVIAYNEEYDRFYAIDVDSYREGKIECLIHLNLDNYNDYFDVYDSICGLDCYNMDSFFNWHKECSREWNDGYTERTELIPNHYTCDEDDLRYIIAYCEYPYISNNRILENSIIEIKNKYSNFKDYIDDNKKAIGNVLKLPEAAIEASLNYPVFFFDNLSIYQKMYEKGSLEPNDFEDLIIINKRLRNDAFKTFGKIIVDNDYSFKELNNYLEKCVDYQKLNLKEAVMMLDYCYKHSKYCDVDIERFPVSLKKQTDIIRYVYENKQKKEKFDRFRNNYPKMLSLYKKYEFQDEMFEIKPEEDCEVIIDLIENEQTFWRNIKENAVYLWVVNKYNGTRQELISLYEYYNGQFDVSAPELSYTKNNSDVNAFIEKFKWYIKQKIESTK